VNVRLFARYQLFIEVNFFIKTGQLSRSPRRNSENFQLDERSIKLHTTTKILLRISTKTDYARDRIITGDSSRSPSNLIILAVFSASERGRSATGIFQKCAGCTLPELIERRVRILSRTMSDLTPVITALRWEPYFVLGRN
jgi:hypothetical protein